MTERRFSVNAIGKIRVAKTSEIAHSSGRFCFHIFNLAKNIAFVLIEPNMNFLKKKLLILISKKIVMCINENANALLKEYLTFNSQPRGEKNKNGWISPAHSPPTIFVKEVLQKIERIVN